MVKIDQRRSTAFMGRRGPGAHPSFIEGGNSTVVSGLGFSLMQKWPLFLATCVVRNKQTICSLR
jgi:hypothetical protein